MRNLILYFTLLFFWQPANSQVYQPIVFPEKVDARYIMNPLKEQAKLQKKLGKTLPKKVALDYSYAATFGKAEKFSGGEIYLNWPALETYVNQVLDSILPANLASKKIRAFIGRSSDINAFCLYDGTMVVNVGLIAEVKSEAALAGVMGHELSHFIKNHGLARVKNIEKEKKARKKKTLDKLFNVQGFSQENELEADLQGFSIASAAHYDLEEVYGNFEMLLREEEYQAKRSKSTLVNTDSVTIDTKAGKYKLNTLEKLLSSHPEMKDRKEKLAAYIKNNPQTRKQKFKMDEDYFYALQAQARLECVSLLLDYNNYNECLERSFIYHLFNPGELTFTYHIAESVRRLCLLDYRLRKKGFLTENLVNDGFKEGEGILHDLRYILPDPARLSKVRAAELSKPGAFETYREAFAYFTKKLLDKNYNEAYLQRALFENNKQKIKDNVAKYLASPNVRHKAYAECYRDSTLTKKISENSKEIVMIPKVAFYKHTVYNYKYNYGDLWYYFQKTEILGSEMSYEFASAFNEGLSDVKTISIPQLATQNFNTRYTNEKVLWRTMMARRDENEGYKVVHYYKELVDEDYIGSTDIFRLDPETWEFFRTNEINALSYANFTRHSNQGGKKLNRLFFFMGIPFAGLFWIAIPLNPVQYKQLDLLSYDARLGSFYLDVSVKSRRLTPGKALRMFKDMKKSKLEFIKEYNDQFN